MTGNSAGRRIVTSSGRTRTRANQRRSRCLGEGGVGGSSSARRNAGRPGAGGRMLHGELPSSLPGRDCRCTRGQDRRHQGIIVTIKAVQRATEFGPAVRRGGGRWHGGGLVWVLDGTNRYKSKIFLRVGIGTNLTPFEQSTKRMTSRALTQLSLIDIFTDFHLRAHASREFRLYLEVGR